jgi:hypothetical protein
MEHKYNASADTVFGLLTDPKWLENRSLALGELSASHPMNASETHA